LHSQEQRVTYQQTIVQLSIKALEEEEKNLYATKNQTMLQLEVQVE
jgi:hypothetical protein